MKLTYVVIHVFPGNFDVWLYATAEEAQDKMREVLRELAHYVDLKDQKPLKEKIRTTELMHLPELYANHFGPNRHLRWFRRAVTTRKVKK